MPLIVTPINQNPRSHSYIDYQEQLEREQDGVQVVWDDTPYNRAKEGDVFAFVRNNTDVTFRMILETHPPEERLASWSKNVGQGNRRVLSLGPELATWSWGAWIDQGGARRVQGTMHIRTHVDRILGHLKHK